MEKEYVIYLYSGENDIRNHYGYWSGKNYTVNYELFSITDCDITDRTKKYSSKARAEKALLSCIERGYAYVSHGEVKELN